MNVCVDGQGQLEVEWGFKRPNSHPSYWEIPTTEKPKVLI